MKNRLSLTTILGIFLLSIVLLGATWCYYLSEDMFLRDTLRENRLSYFFFGILFFTLLFFIIAIGVLFKANWARILLLWSYYFGAIAIAIIFILNFNHITQGEESLFVGIGAAAFGGSFLVGGILFLNTKAVKEEFGIEDEFSSRIKE